jgi:hypothetical protein
LRSKFVDLVQGGGGDTSAPCVAIGYKNPYAVPAGCASLYITAPYLFYYALPVRQMSYSVPVKLLPLPHPPVSARTDARTNPSAQRATQLRSVLARVYAVSIKNQITTNVP